MLKIWDWMSGDVLNEVQIIDSVLPFITVRPPKRKRAKDREGGNGGDSDQRKGRNVGESQTSPLAPDKIDSLDDDPSMEALEPEEGGVPTLIEHSAAPKDRTVLAVHKIRTIDSEGMRHIIFSVVGFVLHCLIASITLICRLTKRDSVISLPMARRGCHFIYRAFRFRYAGTGLRRNRGYINYCLIGRRVEERDMLRNWSR